jgi:phosphatidylglycerol---prolipoprotein diacylglyceryl transferase
MFPFIHIGGLGISTWRVVVVDGVLLCWILFLVRARNLGYPFRSVFLWLVLGLPVGALGGHLFNQLIPTLAGAGNSYPFSGLTVIGSIFSCLLFSFFYIKHVMKTSPLPVLDAVAFTFPLSILIGRIGCLFAGCCYGKAAPASLKTSLLSVFTLPVGLYAESSSAGHDFLGVPRDSLVWNLPLFLMINTAIALIVAEVLYRRRDRWRLYPGTVFSATGALYAGGRFFIEFLRKEEGAGGSLFNPWQVGVAVLFAFFAVWSRACLYRRSRTITRAEPISEVRS